jgi:hypothetical protein
MRQVASFMILMGASALVGSASQAQAPATAPVTASASSSASSTLAAPQEDKFKAPYGYRRVVTNGVERFCTTERNPGSRAQRSEVCLSEAQLRAREAKTQDMLQQVQRSGATATKNCTPAMGAASGMC